VALIGILVVLLIGALIAVFAQPNPGPDPEPSDTPSAEPTESNTPSPTPTVETVAIVESEWIGKTRTAIEALAAELGLRLDPVVRNIAPSKEQEGLSYEINPRGGSTVLPNAVITVFFYAPIPVPERPSNLAIDPGSGPYPGSSNVVLSWPAYTSCPAGFPLTGYDFTIVGGSPGSSLPLAASATELPVTLTASGQLRVTYVAICSTLRSERSNELAIPIG